VCICNGQGGGLQASEQEEVQVTKRKKGGESASTIMLDKVDPIKGTQSKTTHLINNDYFIATFILQA
jgi:hypothetical protein